MSKKVVPEVFLHATHEKALDTVSMAELKAHAARPEAAGASWRQDARVQEGGHGGWDGHEGADRTGEQGGDDQSSVSCISGAPCGVYCGFFRSLQSGCRDGISHMTSTLAWIKCGLAVEQDPNT
jgi:hypothetical protein